MKFLAGIGKEQGTLAGAALIALLLLSGMFGGGPTVRTGPALPRTDRAYTSPPSAAAEYVQDKFGLYWEGNDIFQAKATDKLAVPDIKQPVPRPEALVLLPMRPGPTFESLNSRPVPVKYRALVTGTPSVAAADMPADAELAGLKTLAEPELTGFEDKRNLKMAEFDVIYLTGGRPVQEGRIIAETATGVQFRRKDGATGGEIKWADIDIDKRTGEYRILRSWMYEQEYKYRTAKIKPGNATARVALAEWCREAGMMPEAKAEYRAALEILKARNEFKKEFFDAVAAAGQVMADTADHDGAISLYTTVMDWTDYEKAEMAARIGDVLRSLGVLEGALVAYEKAIEASPRYARGRLGQARTLYDMGRDADAVAAIDLFAKYSDTARAAEKSEAATAKGLALLRQCDLRTAEAAFNDALKSDPKNADALNGLGVAVGLLGQTKDAAGHFMNAIRANQYLTDAWMNLAALALAAGKLPEAEGLFAAAAQRDPSSAEAVAGLALVLSMSGKAPEAVAQLDEALKLDPKHYYVQYVRAHLKMAEGANADALKGYASALQAEFHFLPAYTGAAMAYLASARALETAAGDAATSAANRETATQHRISAETLLNSIRDFDPQRASTYLALGCVLAVMGRGADAEKNFARALEMNPAADALLAYGRGYVAYWYGDSDPKSRLSNAKVMFNQATSITATDPVDVAWIQACKDVMQKIDDWQNTSVLFDDRFERGKAEDVGAGWVERDKQHGVSITLEGGRARFSGEQKVKDMGLTQLERDVPRQEFLSFEVTLFPGAGKCEYGISLYHTKQSEQDWMGLHVGVDMGGKFRQAPLRMSDFAANRLDYFGVEVPKFALPNPKEIRLRFERRSDQRNLTTIDISVWDASKADWVQVIKPVPVMAGGQAQSYRVAVWARSLLKQTFTLDVDNARVLLKRN